MQEKSSFAAGFVFSSSVNASMGISFAKALSGNGIIDNTDNICPE